MDEAATTGDTRQRVVILGGGIASLTAAWYLSNTQDLRDRYQVEVIQLGWRLGGKLASGRQLPGESCGIPDDDRQTDERFGNRNTEHGLHVWFGFYDNAFNLYNGLFDAWDKPADCPWKSWLDAFTPEHFTPLGEVIDGQRQLWMFRWAGNPAQPGGDSVLIQPWQLVFELLDWLLLAIEDFFSEDPAEHALGDHFKDIDRIIDDALRAGGRVATRTALGIGRGLHKLSEVGSLEELQGARATALTKGLQAWARLILPLLEARIDAGDVDAHHVRNLVDLGIAFVIGLLNPLYGLLFNGFNLDAIDHLEFREWLKDNGANPLIVDNWSQVATLYDTMFEYIAGDLNKPNYAAGVAARAFIRIGLTYKGAPLYLVNAGMGETVIGPLYDTLKANGVRFTFFRKVTNLALSADSSRIEAIDMEVQAKTRGDYQPTTALDGLTCWPAEPFWDQIVDGEDLRKEGASFESHWNPVGPVARERLELGPDDRVILGITLGAFKPLNTVDRSLAQELIDQVPGWAEMTGWMPLTPSGGVQLWTRPTLADLGWAEGKPAAVSWAYPMDVWADMTQVLDFEDYPDPDDQPQSLAYMCGALNTDLYKRPSTDLTVPRQAWDQLFQQTVHQLEEWGDVIWPAARDEHGGFDWDVLYDPWKGTGVQRLMGQWIKANVDPTECCTASARGTTRYRMRADGSGVDNLTLAGAWTYNGLNTTCVEAAVTSGMLAAQAVSGDPLDIVGLTFLTGFTD